MSLNICSLNSGSNGNCYYIGNSHEALLVDAGISCRETEKRMKRQGLDPGKLKAIFVSHEHSDHISGVPGLSKKFRLPVYITEETLRYSDLPVDPSLVRPFTTRFTINLGGLSVSAFKKSHDACDPHSFMISCEGVNVGVFTDIGYGCAEVIANFRLCHAAFLESNYCEDMLEKGNYPYHLKQRIRGRQGHLSNSQAIELFTRHRSPHLSHLILSHLSKNNNSPDLVQRLFEPYAGSTSITVASRYGETAVYSIPKDWVGDPAPALPPSPRHLQLSLF
jgi:phosphoribosyl 1,2-cyclic phosphodiesterase